jgi:sugar diacid utilization regulator
VEHGRVQVSLRALQRENSTLRLLIAIHDRLGALVLQGTDPAALTRDLAELVERPVLLLNATLQPLAMELRQQSAGDPDVSPPLWQPNDAYVGRVLETTAGDHRPLRLPPLPDWGVTCGCVLAPVVVGDATAGFVAILEPEAPDADGFAAEAGLLAAQHAASVYAVALMRARIESEVAAQLRDELLEGLLLGEVPSEQAAHERARRLGYDEALAYRALVLYPERSLAGQSSDGEDPTRTAARHRRLIANLAELVRGRAPQAIVTVRNDELVVLAAEGAGPGAADIGRVTRLYVTSLHPDHVLTVGVGGVCRSPTEIARSYAQARRAVEVARRFGRRGEVVTFEALGLYRLLFQVADPGELQTFVEDVLGPLLGYDRKHQTGFVRTLATYLANNNSLQATARELTVHVNTVTYRIQRVQEITGLDLARAEESLLARVALKILEGTELDRTDLALGFSAAAARAEQISAMDGGGVDMDVRSGVAPRAPDRLLG